MTTSPSGPAIPTADAFPPIVVGPKDISGLRAGNVGPDYVHRFTAAEPGPHLLLVGLIHGNEFCGMSALTALLEAGARPTRGAWTVMFANTAAYEAFDPQHPSVSRFVDQDLNRVWSSSVLDGEATSVEIERARALRPVVEEADHILDLHSTILSFDPFWVIPHRGAPRALARQLPVPGTRVVMRPEGLQGTPLIAYGKFADAAGSNTGLVAECGQHWAEDCQTVALACLVDYLRSFDSIDADVAGNLRPVDPPAGPEREMEATVDYVARTDQFRYAQHWRGFDPVGKGTVLAYDGDEPVMCPDENSFVVFSRPHPKPGGEAMTIARLVTEDQA